MLLYNHSVSLCVFVVVAVICLFVVVASHCGQFVSRVDPGRPSGPKHPQDVNVNVT